MTHRYDGQHTERTIFSDLPHLVEVTEDTKEEETKVWHFSPRLLAELFDEEQNGEIDWPEI